MISLRNVSVGIKLTLGNFLLVLSVFVIFVMAIDISISSLIGDRASTEVSEKTKLIVNLIDASDKELRNRTQTLSRGFGKILEGNFSIGSDIAKLGEKSIPSLELNGYPVVQNPALVDDFSLATGGISAVFVKSQEDYIRVLTSLKNEKNERATGMILDKSHPAYKKMIAGESYIGIESLSGRQYMMQYDPIKDDKGQVIGLTFVGLDFTEFMSNIKTTIRSMKIGKTGYFYVLDSKPGSSYGNLIIHPAAEGKNLLSAKDPDGREFIKDMLIQKNGSISYPWINKELGETSPRQKVVAFTHMKNWDWLVAGGTYSEEYTEESRRLRNVFAGIALIAVLLISGFLYVLVRFFISKPLASASACADALSSGDLTATVEIKNTDEVGKLLSAMNKIGSGLALVVQSVRSGSEAVATASAQIASGNHDLSSRTENQASALQETAASMEQMNATVKQNAASSHAADQLATSASQVAIHGGEVVGQVVETMSHINDSSKKISDIISVIEGIAFQTNILALNAAVEAARAGEQGRGFAVVASEVRSLANRSSEAAKEIKALINASVERVEIGTAQVSEAGKTMVDIVSSIKKVSEIVSEISAASVEQSTGVEQVGHAISQMDQATQQNAALVEEMAAAASSLHGQSQELVKTVSVFRI